MLLQADIKSKEWIAEELLQHEAELKVCAPISAAMTVPAHTCTLEFLLWDHSVSQLQAGLF